jgi:tRNA nucleotidyltransferase/poly(A) polymerase
MTNKKASIKIIRQLHHNGFHALLAGGCVRDMLLSRRAKDYDVATNARPEDVIRLFKRTLKVGAQFGVVIVLIEGRQIEVATFRTETGYADGRHPDTVEFTGAAQDAARRDFTINGMFYDPLTERVIDYVNGQADLKKRIIRTIGKPAERFGEDYLRMLRAIRFSTQLGFAIEPSTWSAICANADKIRKISGERIAMELESILTDPNRAAGVSMLNKSVLAEKIFPDFVGLQSQYAVVVLGQLRKKVDFALALAGLFAGCEVQFAADKLRVLKLSRNRIKHIKFLLSNRDTLLDEKMSLARLKKLLAEPYFRDLYELQRAIQKTKGDGRKSLVALINLRKRIKALGDIELRPKPLLNGHDLIRLGAVPGPVLGLLAEELYVAQLEGQIKTQQQAEVWVQKWMRKHRMVEK